MPAREPRPTDPSPGLCATCVHSSVVRGARSQFSMCRLSTSDPSFPRYPRLPVLSCRGYEQTGTPPQGRE